MKQNFDSSAALDRTDIELLEILQSEGRISKARLAEKVGLSAPAVFERVKRLEETQIVRSFAAILNPKKLDLGFLVFISISLTHHQRNAARNLEKALCELPEVLECHQVTGEADFLLKVITKDTDDYQRFLADKMSNISGIQKIQTHVVLSTGKWETKLKLREDHE